jgi:hypothetical protein
MKFLIKIITIAWASSTWAADIAVFPVQVTNLTPQQAEAVGVVIAQQYARISGKEVIPPERANRAVREEGNLASASQELNVSEYIETNAIALDTKILIDAIRRSSTGKQIARAQMTAVSLDDLIEVGDRISRALLEKTSIDQTRTLDNITKLEANPPKKIRAKKCLGVKSSLIFPVISGKFDPLVSIGFDARFESLRYFLEFGAGFLVPSSASERDSYGGAYAEMGASYYLTQSTISPYIGGGVIPRIVSGDVEGVSLAPYVQAGMVFMREYATHFYTDIRVATNALPLREKNMERRSYYPTEVTWQFGIGW